MPKIIADLRERILSTAKGLLLTEGYDALAVRDVARQCGIAVGTVYNYFPSKDMLAASIMLADWLDTLETMRKQCESTDTVQGGLTALYDGIVAFSSVYRSVWTQYTFTGSAQEIYTVRHRQLASQLSILVAELLSRLGYRENEAFCVFLSENLLTYAGSDSLAVSDLLSIVDRILNG